MSFAPLWPQPIPIIGGTGDKWMGKSYFGLNICPGNKTTLVYDFEQSCASYEGEFARIGVPFDRIDVQKEMHAKHPNGYKPLDLFVWWRDHVRALPADKYRVIMLDPATDVERGLTDWVAANPKFFGHTEGQYASMSGIMWGDVKDYQKMILADITARCECFYFTAHIGAEFQGKTATGKKKVKGKETLYELSSLFLWFDRSPDASGVRPNAPAATVLKGRLLVSELVDGDVVSYSVLPPRLPVATPKAIRAYFTKPAGKIGLTDAEKVQEEKLSADERLRLETQKAQAEAETAQARAAAAQSQQVTVPVVIGERAAEFEKTIRAAAETAFLIKTVGPQIKVASDAGEISAAEVGYLRGVFNECGKRLKAKEQPQAA
jgi:hypothetical protein